MEKTILTPNQAQVLDLLKEFPELSSLFYLSGGTALAEFYLHHRFSDDLDFFTSLEEFPQLQVEKFVGVIKDKIPASKVDYRHLFDRRLFFFQTNQEELKIEFTSYPFKQLESPTPKKGLQIDSLIDIAVNKLMVLTARTETKDFVDLYFLAKEKGIFPKNILPLLEKKFKLKLDPVALGSEFAKVKSLTLMPRMIKPLTIEELKKFFTDLAFELEPKIF